MSNLEWGELGRRLQSAFPAAAIQLPIRRLGEGYASEVVQTSNAIVFKLARNQVAQASYRTEHGLLQYLAGQLHNVQIPAPAFYLTSSPDFPFGLLGYRKIDGAHLDSAALNEQQLKALAGRLADFLYQLHHVDLASPPSPT